MLLLPEIAKFYGLDSRIQLSEMIYFVQKLNIIKGILVAEAIKLLKVILATSVTNAVSKRSFSSLKRIHIYLSSTTANNWLNDLLILHIHDLITDPDSILRKLLTSSLKEEKDEKFGL